ncbi:MAG: hypothetical protein WAL95_10340, partial [Candidatus Acidiferrales bacterium]
MGQRLKSLLEEKHLYQSSEPIPFGRMFDALHQQVDTMGTRASFNKYGNQLLTDPFPPSETELFVLDANVRCLAPTFLVQNIKLFCTHCKASETFSPTWFASASTEIGIRHAREARVASPPARYHLYTLAYQCERCKALPVLFIVKRHEWKLSIEGRS